MFHRTERLLLRPAWPEDWETILWGIGDKSVVSNLARAPWPYLPAHAREFAQRAQDPRYPAFLLTLPEDKGARLVGCAGLAETSTGVEIGYWIAQPHWGRGYATEGAGGVLQVARLLGHRRIEGRHFLDNPASGRVLQKLGFKPTGATGILRSPSRAVPGASMLYALDLDAAGGADPDMPLRAA